MNYRRRARLGVAIISLVASSPAAADPHGWDQASSIGRDLLVASALGIPAVQGDWTGDLQAGGSMLVAGGAVYGLKRLFPEERPDQSDRQSFPSGHTAVSFAAAASLENRYGWKAGLPAFAVASFVGLARVEARKHHWYDVVAGAAIGTGSGLLLSSKRNRAVRLTPWADSGGGGFALAARF
ncbi:MAG: phosphatase PAP2 family protein [Sphingomonas sp. SCN 67-18]|nr:MAG: phosphatase PAP2 family protein [Sphingomonas sp. SCN 67-18]